MRDEECRKLELEVKSKLGKEAVLASLQKTEALPTSRQDYISVTSIGSLLGVGGQCVCAGGWQVLLHLDRRLLWYKPDGRRV